MLTEQEAARRSKQTFFAVLFLWSAVFGFTWGYWHLSAAFASVLATPIVLFICLGLLHSGLEKVS